MLYPKRHWFAHSPAFFRWSCWFLARIVGLIFNVRREGLEKLPKGGFLAIAPHVNFLDSIFIWATFPRPPHFIGDAHFLLQNPFLAWLIWAAGVVPVNRIGSDPYAVRKYLRLMAHGDICVIFPEGARSLNAQPIQPMIQATKLISKLKVPVITVALEGAYDAWPRWDAKIRLPRGRLRVRFVEYLRTGSSNEAHSSKPPSLAAVFNHKNKINVGHERQKILDSLKRAAEGEAAAIQLERPGRPQEIPRLLLFCPACASTASLEWQEARRNIQCAKCHFALHIKDNKLGSFSQGQHGPYLTIDRWFNKAIEALAGKNPNELLLATKLKTQIAETADEKAPVWPASMRLDKNGLALRTDQGTTVIPLSVAANGLLEGSDLLIISYKNSTISLISEEGLAPAWIILARRLANLHDLFSES
ncbi:MAG: 1-acyl-sn-glycerol-3-phosphate acyltransferase [Elusimicrobia bacterium]|nr:1-acyl-sn-glycerol-3-phosphate acyltransferase [Elusimicrobiota bacterium]